MATHPSILAWRIPWTKCLSGYNLQGLKKKDMTEWLTHTHTHTHTHTQETTTKNPKGEDWRACGLVNMWRFGRVVCSEQVLPYLALCTSSIWLFLNYIILQSSAKGFPGGSAGKESACDAGDPCSIPRLGRSLGEGKGYLLQYSGLENSISYIVHGVTKSWT